MEYRFLIIWSHQIEKKNVNHRHFTGHFDKGSVYTYTMLIDTSLALDENEVRESYKILVQNCSLMALHTSLSAHCQTLFLALSLV